MQLIYIWCPYREIGDNRMILRQVLSRGLAHYSYYIGAGREAAVIDPRRDCGIYLELAREHDQEITCIFETHRNEDYVTGSCELAARCRAEIFHGPVTPFSFGKTVCDGNRVNVGDLEIIVLETPGHTPDSISLVVSDKKVSPGAYLVFTGDALFAGDVGRVDLFGKGRDTGAAGMLHDSIWNKILSLGDEVIVCPAHGSGSVCGTEIADHPLTTIGYEKKSNPHLKKSRSAFIRYKSGEHHYVPPYFRTMEELNLKGPDLVGRIPDLVPYSVRQVKELIARNAQVIDIRAPASFGSGHIRGSLSIWRDGLPAYMGWFIDYASPIIVVDDFNLEFSSVLQHCTRLGYDNLEGYLAGGFGAWYKAGEEYHRHRVWSVFDLHEAVQSREEALYILDVRDILNREKYGHIPADHHMYVGEIPENTSKIPVNADIILYCDAGYKGSLAASYLEKHGYPRVTNILGGMAAWMAAGLPVEQ